MIVIEGCSKFYQTASSMRVVLNNIDARIGPLERVAIIADQGAGKSVMARLLRGQENPDEGRIHFSSGLIWSPNHSGYFHPALTAEQNVRSIALLLGLDPDKVSSYCWYFALLGRDYFEPFGLLSSSLRARLAWSLSLALPVNMYICDEMSGMGDGQFRLKCEHMLFERLHSAGLVLLTRNVRLAEKFGQRFGVLCNGRLQFCDSFRQAKDLFGQRRSATRSAVAELAATLRFS